MYDKDYNYVRPFLDKELDFWSKLEDQNPKWQYQNLLICSMDGEPLARCTAIKNLQLHSNNGPIGMIGNFECLNNFQAFKLLIQSAEAWLLNNGCSTIYAPINFNTWMRYRLKINNFDQKRYLFEPYNPKYYPSFFFEVGYLKDKLYFTQDIEINQLLSKTTEKFNKTLASGIKLRAFDTSRFDEEIHQLYKVTVNSFQANFLYSNLDFNSFYELYSPYKHVIDPRFFAIAEDDHNVVGFLFCIPDLIGKLQAMGGKNCFWSKLKFLLTPNNSKLLLAKTMAVLPEYRNSGIGASLMYFSHNNAKHAGFNKARHCLFIDDNFSGKYSQNNQKPWEYALLKKELG